MLKENIERINPDINVITYDIKLKTTDIVNMQTQCLKYY